jgi:ADP-ribose pyrophosphatase
MNESRLVYQGKHLHFYVHKTGWEFVSRSKASQGVTIVAVTEKMKLVLVEQYRIPIGAVVIELPAGLVGDTHLDEEDNAIAAAKRELKEETGYSCEEVEIICNGSFLPGLTDEINTLCWAKGLSSQDVINDQHDDQIYKHETKEGLTDEGEETCVYDVPLARVEDWLKEQIEEGKVVDMKVYLGVFFFRSIMNT